MKKLVLITIISIFLPGCFVVDPVPVYYETVVVEEPLPVITVGYPICEYIEDPYPFRHAAYCTSDSCVWEFYYASYYCEEEWYYSYDCGWELGYSGCYYYAY